MELKILDSKNNITISDHVFSCDFNEPLVHQMITAYMAAKRTGNKAQKTRAEVSGGGAKPFRQKGTGRARAGTIRSPLWRTGGVVFAAKPRCYKQKINKKMYKGALRVIFSELIRQNRLVVVDQFQIEEPKTKVLLKKLTSMKITGNTLIIDEQIPNNICLAARNLYDVNVAAAAYAVSNPLALVKAETIVITEPAIKAIEEFLK